MSNIKNKIGWFKYRIRDWTWNNRGILVPGGTGLASIVWFCIEPSPEPVVLLTTTFLAAFVWHREDTDKWYTATQGSRYEIWFRADGSEHKEREEKVTAFISNFNYIYKWGLLSVGGDGLSRVTIDTLDDNDKDIIQKAKKIFVLYSVTKNGHQIYERGIG